LARKAQGSKALQNPGGKKIGQGTDSPVGLPILGERMKNMVQGGMVRPTNWEPRWKMKIGSKVIIGKGLEDRGHKKEFRTTTKKGLR